MQSISVTYTKLYILYSIYMYVCVYIYIHTHTHRAAPLLAQVAKNLPAMHETQVWSLGQEDPLEKGMTTHSSILACRIPWTEETGRLQSMRSQRVRQNWATNTHTHTHTHVTIHISHHVEIFLILSWFLFLFNTQIPWKNNYGFWILNQISLRCN